MTAIAFAAPALTDLIREMLVDERETCGVIFTRSARLGARPVRLLAARAELAPEGAYRERTPTSSTLSAAYVLDVANRARAGGFGLCLFHTHPRDQQRPRFSWIDDAGERALVGYLGDRVAGALHIALVVSPGGMRARVLGADEEIDVVEVGANVRNHSDFVPPSNLDVFDRQVRAFGSEGQAILARIRVGIVGLGGTGSVTAQQLAHLGVGSFLLIDPDNVEATNLNRLVGAAPDDIGVPKVEVARRTILRVNPNAQIESLIGDVVDVLVARSLLTTDFIFICTDSHASRAVVSQLAYQYLLPTVDMGVSISIRGGRVAFITGRVQMLAPRLPCLTCLGAIDPEQVRREMLSPAERAADRYIVGAPAPAPAVISLNSTVASLAVSMALGALSPIPMGSRFQSYDGVNGTVRNMGGDQDPHCFVCSPEGALTQADAWPLPTRSAP